MNIDFDRILFAFSLTLLAGLSTGIGSLMAFMSKKFNHKFLAGALGFSAGVMIYVSMIEIFVKARTSLSSMYGDKHGYCYTVIAFFAGIAIIALIDRLVPEYENPHELVNFEHATDGKAKDRKLMRLGLFSAIAIGIHNFPEGLATFIGALHDPALGISITAAIAIHNIPEGIAVSIPIYYATKSRGKAFFYSFTSGFAEPVGALLGYFFLVTIFNDAAFGVVFACVAGIMVYISLDELLPTAEEYGEHHVAILGLIGGMVVMAASLLLFA
ncbi:MAG TPA: zinc transporter ZupT [Spirochaetota bacterium]|nr:zinc transporter ZupT [Spirochaetota bacterium]HPJ33700.1 zinc transporter ZupT [Spirochaetota bacterium]